MLKLFASGARAVASRTPGVLRDLAGLAGVGLISYGSWLVYEPAGFIVGGVMLLGFAIVSGFAATAAAGKAD